MLTPPNALWCEVLGAGRVLAGAEAGRETFPALPYEGLAGAEGRAVAGAELGRAAGVLGRVAVLPRLGGAPTLPVVGRAVGLVVPEP